MPFASFLRLFLRDLGFTLAALTATAASLLAQTPSAADGFDPNSDGNVLAVATQTDGKIIVAGQFAVFRNSTGFGFSRNNIARFSPEGAPDEAFNPNANGAIRALVIQPDGKIIIGGDFTTLQPIGAAAPIARNRIARLNADGTLDASFSAGFSGLLLPQVNALVLQPDGRIVVGGSFTTFQTVGAAQGPISSATRNYLARLNADGSLDAGYDPNPNSMVLALALHVDGKVIVGGGFTRFQENGKAEATVRNRIARLNPSGTVDSEFDPNANNGVTSLAVQRDGRIIVGGFFTTLFPIGYPPRPVGADAFTKLVDFFKTTFPTEDVTSPAGQNAFNAWAALVLRQFGVGRWEELPIDFAARYNHGDTVPDPPVEATPAAREHIARLHVDGGLDADFVSNTSGSVFSVAVEPDGGVLVGGTFSTVWSRGTTTFTRSNLVRFTPEGAVDLGFNPGLNQSVNALAFQSDGKIVAGGYFTHAQPVGTITPISRNRVARINPDGSLDASFEIDQGGRILASVVQADGRIVIGGTFTNVGGASHNYMARLNADGTIDPTYNPDLNGRVLNMVLQPDGKVIIAGAFSTIGGERRIRVARLNPGGTIDSEFYPAFEGGDVGALALQGDGKILVGGSFTAVQAVGAPEFLNNRSYIIRLNADGTLDSAFDPSPNSRVSFITLQPDGKILVGGDFLAFTPGGSANPLAESTLRFSVARLNADGTVDKSYDPSLSGPVNAIVVQSDGKAVMGGLFTSLQPQDTTSRVTPPRRNRIARFNTDGTLDTTFDPNANGPVMAMGIQSDGKVVIGGSFTTLQPNGAADWTLRRYAARLNTDGTIDTSFNLDINDHEQSINRVDSVRVQADGRILIGGSFASVRPIGSPNRVPRKYLARINSDGTLDAGFEVKAGGSAGGLIKAFAVQPDARIIVVGSFSDLGGAKSTNIARFIPEGPPDPTFSGALTTDGTVNAVVMRPNGRLVPSQVRSFAWLNRDGSIRPAFNPGPDSPIAGDVFAVATESDGSVLLVGNFTKTTSPISVNIARFQPNGQIDPDFNPVPNASISDVAVQADGRIVVVGSFTSINGVARNRVARLESNGALDGTYDPNANSRVVRVVLQSDGKAIVAGTFTGFVPAGQSAAVPQPYIGRLNIDGSLDRAYATIPNAPINALAIQPDGKVIAGGEFTIVQSNSQTFIQTRNHIVRLNTDGTLDSDFDPNVNGVVNAVDVQSNGQVVLGGFFNIVQPNGSAIGITRNNVARVNADGTLDTLFNPNANGAVTTIAVQPDDSVVLGGVFTTLQPTGEVVPITRNHLGRVINTGAIDLDFNPDVNGTVFVVEALPGGDVLVGGSFTGLQPTGAIVVGGSFNSIGGVPARNLAILNDNGSVSSSFQPRPNGAVNTLLALPDGRAVVGGAFTSLAGATRNRVARFNAEGSLDADFNPNLSGEVFALALQPDGKVLVGGSFTTVGSAARNSLARVNPDGTPDTTFGSPPIGAGLAVRAIALQADGRIVVIADGGGTRHVLTRLNADGTSDSTFSALSSGSASFNSIALQTDGRIVLAGDFTTLGGVSVARLARVNPNGTVDPTFNPTPNNAVTAVAVQADGRVMIGGSFTKVGELSRVALARLAPTAPAVQAIGVTANRTAVIWNRSGTGGEIAAVIFEISTDRRNWTQLGTAARIAGTPNWQLSGVSLPPSGVFYIRARGIAPATAGSSSGIFELLREFSFTSPVGAAVTTVEMPAGSAPGTPAHAAAPMLMIDPFTGITPRQAITVVPGEGTLEILAATEFEVGPDGTTNSAHLVNLSTRGRVTAGSPLILGFAVAGTEPRSILLRAVGPGLTGFGVEQALPGTRLELYDSAGGLLTTNEGWANAAALTQAALQTGAFPLAADSADSAILMPLAPGSYTIHVVDPRGLGGIGLAEIYDAGTGSGSRLVNVSSLGHAGTGNEALISGFVIGGGAAERVLLRGVGPGLGAFNVSGTVADPSIGLFDGGGQSMGWNDNWVSSVPQVSSAAAGSGAFALQAGSKDAAVLATLPTGAYTIQVSAGGGAAGKALLEIYETR